jgi:hypothetical protein
MEHLISGASGEIDKSGAQQADINDLLAMLWPGFEIAQADDHFNYIQSKTRAVR